MGSTWHINGQYIPHSKYADFKIFIPDNAIIVVSCPVWNALNCTIKRPMVTALLDSDSGMQENSISFAGVITELIPNFDLRLA